MMATETQVILNGKQVKGKSRHFLQNGVVVEMFARSASASKERGEGTGQLQQVNKGELVEEVGEPTERVESIVVTRRRGAMGVSRYTAMAFSKRAVCSEEGENKKEQQVVAEVKEAGEKSTRVGEEATATRRSLFRSLAG